jgi:hypothetical protein
LKSFIAAGLGVLTLSGNVFARDMPIRPMFAHGIGLHPNIVAPTALPTWTFNWTYEGQKYNAVFVGTDPTGGKSTTVPVYIIPIRLSFKTSSGTVIADPTVKDYTGKSPVDTTVDSPIFQKGITYKQGGTDIGDTQYEDAFQRAALWGTVKKHTGYHVLLGKPTIEKRVSFTIPRERDHRGHQLVRWRDHAAIDQAEDPGGLAADLHHHPDLPHRGRRLLHRRLSQLHRHAGLFAFYLHIEQLFVARVQPGRFGPVA